MWLWVVLALLAIGTEVVLTARSGNPVYSLKDSEISLGLATGWLAAATITGLLTYLVIAFGYSHRFVEAGLSSHALLLLFPLADFLYYCWHRANHRWRWLWATHVAHHTAPRLNFLASFRQGWTDTISGTWLFWLPLGFLGFTPLQCGAYFGALLAWQFFVHNEWTPKLGPVEWIMVTPSHHRVHHSIEADHLDRNFGGIFIVWDRLFGTYAEESVRLRNFGLVGHPQGGPIQIAFGEWRAIWSGIVSRGSSARHK